MYLYGTTSTITGSLSDLPASMTYLSLYSTPSTITGGTGLSVASAQSIYLHSTNVTAAQVDGLLISAANQSAWSGGKVFNVGGTNPARTSASNTAKSTLLGYGVAVTVNE
jgi:hypothetical protein